jgi:hypothetical protein
MNWNVYFAAGMAIGVSLMVLPAGTSIQTAEEGR